MEEEIVIPNGRFEGDLFICERQPYTALWFDAVDSGLWNRFVATGPTQSGKTLSCFVAVAMWHLFEIGETVLCGLPDLKMADDKWRDDFLPVIERGRYEPMLPQRGPGSRGGKVKDAVQFRNGRVLKFMSGGGGDKARSAFTSRVLVVTETDGLDEPGGSSREADKLKQLEARTDHYGSDRRIYLECTVSIAKGRTWKEIKGGTDSRIALRCPHCAEWVSPGRKSLVGWEDADDVIEARDTASFSCPACGALWSEVERRVAHDGAQLVHRGQEIIDGQVVGDLPRTDTLGFRWTATNNFFVDAGDVGMKEWRAKQDPDDDDMEKELCQFVWAEPYDPAIIETTPLKAIELAQRVIDLPRGVVPKEAQYLTMGIDVNKYVLHWGLFAWKGDATGHVVEYEAASVLADSMDTDAAILLALRQLRDEALLVGWPREGSDEGDPRCVPSQVWIDSGWYPSVVNQFCRECVAKSRVERFHPYLGYGEGQKKRRGYSKPKTSSGTVRYLGEEFHAVKLKAEGGIHRFDINADHWKSWVHERLTTPVPKPGETSPGAMTLYRQRPSHHFRLARQLTAEKCVEEFQAGRGTVTRWDSVRRDNHWFDAFYAGSAAGYFSGARLTGKIVRMEERAAPKRSGGGLLTPDGRPFVATERK